MINPTGFIAQAKSVNTQHTSIAALLKEARSLIGQTSDTAQLDAEILLSHCLGKNRAYLYTWPEITPDAPVVEQFQNLIEQRAQDIPLAYVTGEREFWSLPFKVTPDTLIPRPETELIVQLALDLLRSQPGPLLDLGTGSGAIAVSIATELKQIPIDAADNSRAALKIAKYNATQHNVDINFIESDWFEHISRTDYQIIISNPPYIAEHDVHLTRGGLQHEPLAALQATDDGLAAIKTIARHARHHAPAGGWLLIEHGHDQGPQTRDVFLQSGLTLVRTEKDLESRDRVTLGQFL